MEGPVSLLVKTMLASLEARRAAALRERSDFVVYAAAAAILALAEAGIGAMGAAALATAAGAGFAAGAVFAERRAARWQACIDAFFQGPGNGAGGPTHRRSATVPPSAACGGERDKSAASTGGADSAIGAALAAIVPDGLSPIDGPTGPAAAY